MAGHIVAMGGGGFMVEYDSPLERLLLSLAGKTRPRICYVPTPGGDSDRGIARFFEAFSRRDCEPSCLRLFGVPERPVAHLAEQDIVYVSGGKIERASDLASPRRRYGAAGGLGARRCGGWDERGRELLVRVLRHRLLRAGDRSATRRARDPARELLLDYDGEERRRPAYRALVDGGFPAGYAADDCAALHFEGTELREVVCSRAGACAYRVEAGNETPLDARLL